jgi:hypothetical protein
MKNGSSRLMYSPWMCGSRWEKEVPDSLLAPPLTLDFALVEDRAYLSMVSEFLASNGKLLDKLIGERVDWSIAEDFRETNPYFFGDYVTAMNIVNRSIFFKYLYSSLIRMVIPLRQERPRGSSLHDARGMILIGFNKNYNPIDLALDIVHELGHQALAIVQSADAIFADDPYRPVYSEVRKTERPAIQSLHAAAAIAFMVKLLSDLGMEDHVHPDFDCDMRVVLGRAIRWLEDGCQFTPVGRQIMSDFREMTI